MNNKTTNTSYARTQQNKTAPSDTQPDSEYFNVRVPSIELPRGGGSIKGIEEKF